MFEYEIWYKDRVYGDTCKVSGRITANNPQEAGKCLESFYENVIHYELFPLKPTEETEEIGEWDLGV